MLAGAFAMEKDSPKAKILRVSKETNPVDLKTAIMGYLRSHGTVQLDTIGVAANYIATKAVILVSGAMAMEGEELQAKPAFWEALIDNPSDADVKTGIRWFLRKVS